MITVKYENLLNFTEDAVGQGCNCFSNMCAGVALALKNTYPEIFETDKNSLLKPVEKLGNFTKGILKKNGKTFYNIYSQFDFGINKVYLNYQALEKSLTAVLKDMKLNNLKSLALPKIGCGLAGGEWDKVLKILEKIDKMFDSKIKIVIYHLKKK